MTRMLRTLGGVNCIYLSENICPPTASPRPFSHSSIARVSDYEGHRPGGRRTYLTTRFPQRIAPKLDLVWPGLSTEDSLVVAWMEEDFPREEVPKGPFCFPRAPTPKKLRSGVRSSFQILFLLLLLRRKIPKFRSLAKEGRYEGRKLRRRPNWPHGPSQLSQVRQATRHSPI